MEIIHRSLARSLCRLLVPSCSKVLDDDSADVCMFLLIPPDRTFRNFSIQKSSIDAFAVDINWIYRSFGVVKWFNHVAEDRGGEPSWNNVLLGIGKKNI